MSECVVRMEMPRDGLCDLAFSFLDGTFCTIEGNRCNYCDDGAIPKWCPILCQLPEGHGRLVDADAAFAEIVKRSIKGYISNTGVYAALQETPTAAPAEDEYPAYMSQWLGKAISAERSET